MNGVLAELRRGIILGMTLLVVALLVALIWIGLTYEPIIHRNEDMIRNVGPLAVGIMPPPEPVDVSCELSNLGGCF